MSTISNNDIARAIYLSLKDDLEVLPPLGGKTSKYAKVIQFLVRKRLMQRAEAILEQLKKVINFEKGIVSATVISPHRIHEKKEKDIVHFLKKRYSAKKVDLNNIFDKNLLGGVRIEVNDEVIDLTIRNKMNKLQEYLTMTK